MLHKYKLFSAFFIAFLSIALFFSFSACNQEEALPFSVSDQAIRYTYPKKNIIALKSITVDETEVGSQYIFEFDISSKYVTKEGIEAILEDMDDAPYNYLGDIVAESEDQIHCEKIDYHYNKKSVFLYFVFESKSECSKIIIKKGGIICILSAPWNEPNTKIITMWERKNGVEGTLYQKQTFDCTKQEWNKVSEEFNEDLGDAIN